MSRQGNIFLIEGRDYLCPECKNGSLCYRDHCKRIVRHEGGEAEWIYIPRCKCMNLNCKRIHRMLPDFLIPHKHYEEAVIVDAIDGRIDPDDCDDRPSRQTVNHWKYWLLLNQTDIDGHMKAIGHRELGFSEELLKSSISLLSEMRRSIPEGWLKLMIRFIYNSGGVLRPFYDRSFYRL